MGNNPFVPQQVLPDTSNPLTAQAPNSADAWQANAAAYQQWADAQRKDGIARGLIDPETGWPTGAALVDAAHQYGGALMAGTSTPTSVAGRIAGYASKLGYAVDRDSSKISGSEYLNLTHDALPDTTLKVRVSDHDLPPSYGPPGDYDVHSGTPRDFSVGWADAIKGLADRVGAPVPGAAASVINKAKVFGLPASEASQMQAQFPADWKAIQSPFLDDVERWGKIGDLRRKMQADK